MPRIMRSIALFSVLAAISALSAASLASAAEQEGCPDNQRSCLTRGGWTITLLDDYPKLSQGVGTNNRCPAGKWEYRYQVCKPGTNGTSCNAAGLLRMNLAVPDCCPSEKAILLTKAAGCKEPLLTFPVGNGDPITKFEKGDQFVYAARLPFWGPRIEDRSFCANTESLGPTSVCLDRLLNPTLDCCKIQGPSCVQEISSLTVSYVFGPDKWVFVKTNPSVECFDEVYGCLKGDTDEICVNPKNKINPTPIADILKTDSGATIVAADGECIVWAQFGQGTERCSILGGVKYCICTDSVNGRQCTSCPTKSSGRCKVYK